LVNGKLRKRHQGRFVADQAIDGSIGAAASHRLHSGAGIGLGC
jgi:hypothetical protein